MAELTPLQLVGSVWPGYLEHGKWVAEPKFDGIRAFVYLDPDTNRVVAKTRGNISVCHDNVAHILEELEGICGSGFVLDGEFLAENDWGKTQSITSSKSKHPDCGILRFYAFDMLTLTEFLGKGSLMPYWTRKTHLKAMLFDAGHIENVRYVPHYDIENEEDVKKHMDRFVQLGYEGGVLKERDSHYVTGSRSKWWLRVKPIHTGDFRIVGVLPGEARLAKEPLFSTKERVAKKLGIAPEELDGVGFIGALLVSDGKDINSRVGTGFTDDQRLELSYLAKKGVLDNALAEIEYQEVTVGNALRFPAFKRLRTDKTEVNP